MTGQNYDREPRAAEPRFHCPSCGTAIDPATLECRQCGSVGTRRHGIASFAPEEESTGAAWIADADLESLLELADERSIRDAARVVLGGHDQQDRLLSELFDVRRDAWLALLGPAMGGCCLDLSAGTGRRSMVLAEAATTVYAVDRSLPKLRVLDSRSDYDSRDRVIPVHMTERSLPFPEDHFDTVVADLTTAHGSDFETQLRGIAAHLADDGTAVCLVDGWTGRLGSSSVREQLDSSSTRDRPGSSSIRDRLGSAPSLPSVSDGFSPSTPNGYAAIGRAAGFDAVDVYAPFPSARDPLFLFDVTDDGAIQAMLELIDAGGSPRARAATTLLELATRVGLFERLLPNYLVVCHGGALPDHHGPSAENPFDEPLVIPGRARSVVLDVPDSKPRRVWKVPNRRAHIPFTEREGSVLSYLNDRDDPITETIPSGENVETRFGAARVEEPVEGTRLDETLGSDLESFDRILRLGFEWLIEFQRTFRGETVVRSPTEVREDLRFEPAGIEPPAIDEPIETFTTPVHGDFNSQNVLVRDGDVVGVIDWEYSAVEANPIVDAGFLLLDTANLVFGGFREGYSALFLERTDHASVARGWIETYCDALGLPIRTFERYLPSVYLHRLELDWRFDAVSTYTTKMDERTDLVEFMLETPTELSKRDATFGAKDAFGTFLPPRRSPEPGDLRSD